MELTDAIYGAPPIDLGFINLSPEEMMFWLYCPIKLPGLERRESLKSTIDSRATRLPNHFVAIADRQRSIVCLRVVVWNVPGKVLKKSVESVRVRRQDLFECSWPGRLADVDGSRLQGSAHRHDRRAYPATNHLATVQAVFEGQAAGCVSDLGNAE